MDGVRSSITAALIQMQRSVLNALSRFRLQYEENRLGLIVIIYYTGQRIASVNITGLLRLRRTRFDLNLTVVVCLLTTAIDAETKSLPQTKGVQRDKSVTFPPRLTALNCKEKLNCQSCEGQGRSVRTVEETDRTDKPPPPPSSLLHSHVCLQYVGKQILPLSATGPAHVNFRGVYVSLSASESSLKVSLPHGSPPGLCICSDVKQEHRRGVFLCVKEKP
ncbi:hypothetical protein Q8A73_015759 [Channa argus]|nr:hypothetical protein Q8A73_015759 [Channa argus]